MSFKPVQPGVKFGHFNDIGCTIAYRINDDSQTISFGVAYKHDNDPINHKLGRQIAQGRLLKGGHFSGSIPFSEYNEAHEEGTPLKHANIIKYLDFVRGTDDKLLPAAVVKFLKNYEGS